VLAGAFDLIAIAPQHLFLVHTHEERSNVAHVICALTIALLFEHLIAVFVSIDPFDGYRFVPLLGSA
jgi:hypothetical protein